MVVGEGGQKRTNREGERHSIDESEEISCLLRDKSFPETMRDERFGMSRCR